MEGARHDYVHGYSGREGERLADQADTLAELLHSDTFYPSGSVVLEVGCGVGAQTVSLARRSPEATIVAMDISADSLAAARASIRSGGFRNVVFQQANVYSMTLTTSSSASSWSTFHDLAKPWGISARCSSQAAPSRSSRVTMVRHIFTLRARMPGKPSDVSSSCRPAPAAIR